VNVKANEFKFEAMYIIHISFLNLLIYVHSRTPSYS